VQVHLRPLGQQSGTTAGIPHQMSSGTDSYREFSVGVAFAWVVDAHLDGRIEPVGNWRATTVRQPVPSRIAAEVVMINRLRKPGGMLGTLSLLSAFALALIGIVGAVAMLVSIALGSDFWSDKDGDKVIALVFFVLALSGAVGFLVMDRSPWLGAALSVVGGLATAAILFWAIIPVVIGLGAAVVAVIRARAFHSGTTPAPSAT
jgi:hypothetical protein